MTVTLDKATADLVERELQLGHFSSAEEVLLCALQRLATSETAHPDAEQWLQNHREEVELGIEESFAEDQRGEGYSPEEALAHLEKRRLDRAA